MQTTVTASSSNAAWSGEFRRTRELVSWVGAAALLPLWALLLSEVWALSPAGNESVLVLARTVVLGLILASLFAMVVAVAMVGTPNLRWAAVVIWCAAVTYLGSAGLTTTWLCECRRGEFQQLEFRSQVLIDAIKTYERDHGAPPPTLQTLVPEFLPAVPSTGIGAYPEYHYVAGDEARKHYDGNSWALYVDTPSGGLGFDLFLYLPGANYPRHGYGGAVEPYRIWAYVHE